MSVRNPIDQYLQKSALTPEELMFLYCHRAKPELKAEYELLLRDYRNGVHPVGLKDFCQAKLNILAEPESPSPAKAPSS